MGRVWVKMMTTILTLTRANININLSTIIIKTIFIDFNAFVFDFLLLHISSSLQRSWSRADSRPFMVTSRLESAVLFTICNARVNRSRRRRSRRRIFHLLHKWYLHIGNGTTLVILYDTHGQKMYTMIVTPLPQGIKAHLLHHLHTFMNRIIINELSLFCIIQISYLKIIFLINIYLHSLI